MVDKSRRRSRRSTRLPPCLRLCRMIIRLVHLGQDPVLTRDVVRHSVSRARTPTMVLRHGASHCFHHRSRRTSVRKEKACLLTATANAVAPMLAELVTTLDLAWPLVVAQSPVLLVRAPWEVVPYLASTMASKTATHASATPMPAPTPTVHQVLLRHHPIKLNSATLTRHLLVTTSSPTLNSRTQARHRTDHTDVMQMIARLASR